MAFSDDFNRADDADIGNGWTENTPANWAIVSNKARLTPGATFFLSNFLRAPAGGDFRNGTVEAKFTMVASAIPQVHARFQQGDLSSILAYWASGTLYVAYGDGTISAATLNSTAIALTNGTDYIIQLICDGTNHTAKILNGTTRAELASTAGTTSNQDVKGESCISGQSADIDYDDFVATPADPVLQLTDVVKNGTHILANETGVSLRVYDDTNFDKQFEQTVTTDASGNLTNTTIEDNSLVAAATYHVLLKTSKYEVAKITTTAVIP
jgi:hypothetical protein